MAAKKKTASKKSEFKANDFVVYPAHGVGKITGIEKQEVAGHKLELIVINKLISAFLASTSTLKKKK